MKTMILCTTAAATLLASQASAQVSGQMILIDTDVTTVTASQIDIWGYEVTNNSGFDISTFELSFSGNFVQGASTTGSSATLEIAPGVVLADTLFVNDGGTAPSAVGATDDASTLSGSASVLGESWVSNGTSGFVAVFSVDPGGAAPIFDGGVAVVNGERVDVVPEPGSLALLGLGGLALLRRRR